MSYQSCIQCPYTIFFWKKCFYTIMHNFTTITAFFGNYGQEVDCLVEFILILNCQLHFSPSLHQTLSPDCDPAVQYCIAEIYTYIYYTIKINRLWKITYPHPSQPSIRDDNRFKTLRMGQVNCHHRPRPTHCQRWLGGRCKSALDICLTTGLQVPADTHGTCPSSTTSFLEPCFTQRRA